MKHKINWQEVEEIIDGALPILLPALGLLLFSLTMLIIQLYLDYGS